MPSDLAMHKAGQAWSTEETKHMNMNVKLATEFGVILDRYIEALRWCSGSNDFSPEGQAHQGWLKIQSNLLE